MLIEFTRTDGTKYIDECKENSLPRVFRYIHQVINSKNNKVTAGVIYNGTKSQTNADDKKSDDNKTDDKTNREKEPLTKKNSRISKQTTKKKKTERKNYKKSSKPKIPFAYKRAKEGLTYYGFLLPANALYGFINKVYNYKTDKEGNIKKRIVSHDTIRFIVDDFIPVIKTDKHTGELCYVYNVRIYNDVDKEWMQTITDETSKYYLLAEYLSRVIVAEELMNTKCIYNHQDFSTDKICGWSKRDKMDGNPFKPYQGGRFTPR